MSKSNSSSLPVLLASSVIRSTHQGESHGGVYLINMEEGASKQVIDWNDADINWEGRGADRGLRGIAFYKENIYLAASDEIFVYDQEFKLIESFKNRYLQHCHEIYIAGDLLYVSSTGFDSVLVFDLLRKKFVQGYCIRAGNSQGQFSFNVYNPSTQKGPQSGDTIHINNVFKQDDGLYVSSIVVPNLMVITEDHKLSGFAQIPTWTHNARPYLDGVLLNDTGNEKVSFLNIDGTVKKSFNVKRYPEEELSHIGLPEDHARQAFARGLCVSEDGSIFSGSSPSTISVYRLDATDVLKTVNLTMDIRNSVHGLEIWPF